MDEDGHPIAMRKHAAMERDVQRLDGDIIETRSDLKSLDVNLQREMRDLDGVSTSRIDALDETLQREMRMLMDLGTAERQALREKINSNTIHLDIERFNMPDYDRMIAPRLDRLEDRISSIEKSRYSSTDAKTDQHNTEKSLRNHAERISRMESSVEKSLP